MNVDAMSMIYGLILLIAIVFFIKYFLYRRQIQDICRQLKFLQEHESNKRIQTTLSAPEILFLEEYLNEIYDRQTAYRINLQKKDRRMKEMLANVSHDIRTPLTSLKGYFQLLTAEEHAAKRQKYKDVIQEKLDELTDLLEELFTYTKLQNEEYTLELVQTDYTALVLETLFSLYEMFKLQGIAPQMDITEEPCMVCCNPAAVKRILANIIRNAVLHGTGQIRIHYYTEDTKVYFCCENTLASPEDIDITQVFDRFYKADQARSRQSSGLGLSIAKSLAEKMGGQIKAELKDRWFAVQVQMDVHG